jgi:hypothetical protein
LFGVEKAGEQGKILIYEKLSLFNRSGGFGGGGGVDVSL